MRDIVGNKMAWGDRVVVVKGNFRGLIGEYEDDLDETEDIMPDEGELLLGVICITNHNRLDLASEIRIPANYVRQMPTEKSIAKEILENFPE